MKNVKEPSMIVKKTNILIAIGILSAILGFFAVVRWPRNERTDQQKQSPDTTNKAPWVEAYILSKRPALERLVKQETQLEENTRHLVQQIYLETLESADHYLKDPQAYIDNLINFALQNNKLKYHVVAGIIGREHLPYLKDLLQDRNYIAQWPSIALIIGYMGAGKEGADILMDYFVRDDFTEPLDSNTRFLLLNTKLSALRSMVLTGDTTYNDILSRALTPAGAEHLAPWINNPLSYGGKIDVPGREQYLGRILQDAAINLYMCGTEEDKITIRNLYEKERALVRQPDWTLQSLQRRQGLFNALVIGEFMDLFSAEEYYYAFASIDTSNPDYPLLWNTNASIYHNTYSEIMGKYR